jgi:hypothetical protein
MAVVGLGQPFVLIGCAASLAGSRSFLFPSNLSATLPNLPKVKQVSEPISARLSWAGCITNMVRQEKPDASSGRHSRLGKGNEPPHRESSLGLMEATT